MGQKTNSIGFRLNKTHSWINSSFFAGFNYKRNTCNDFIILKFLSGLLKFLLIEHSIINLQRISNRVIINIGFFNPSYWFIKNIRVMKKKNRRKKRRFKRRGFSKVSIKGVLKSFYLKSFNIFRSWYLKKKKINIYKYLLKRIEYIFIKRRFKLHSNINLSLNSMNILPLIKKSYLISLFISKLYFIYSKQVTNRLFSLLYIYYILYLRVFLFLFYDKNKFKFLSNIYKIKMKCVVNQYEGVSIKRLIGLVTFQVLKLRGIKINFIQFNRPKKKTFRFFKNLKKNMRVKAPFKKPIINVFIVLYLSVFFKCPDMVGAYLIKLIKTNIKKVRPLFFLLTLLLPYFFKVLQLRGLRIQLKGRINGSKRTRILKAQFGQIPLTTVSSNICYSFNKSMTIHGVYGLRIWLLLLN